VRVVLSSTVTASAAEATASTHCCPHTTPSSDELASAVHASHRDSRASQPCRGRPPWSLPAAPAFRRERYGRPSSPGRTMVRVGAGADSAHCHAWTAEAGGRATPYSHRLCVVRSVRRLPLGLPLGSAGTRREGSIDPTHRRQRASERHGPRSTGAARLSGGVTIVGTLVTQRYYRHRRGSRGAAVGHAEASCPARTERTW
jgi:hypothetical protein